MAIQVNFGTSELPDSTGFIFFETTGNYNNPSNLSGWNSPNTAYSTAYFAQITIHDTEGNLIGGADVEYAFTLFDSTPTSTIWSTPKLTVLASDYGLTVFTDGVYRVTYTARSTQGGSIISTFEKYVWFDSQFQTNMKNAALAYPGCGCGGNQNFEMCKLRGLDISGFFQVESGNYTTAQEINQSILKDSINPCIEC